MSRWPSKRPRGRARSGPQTARRRLRRRRSSGRTGAGDPLAYLVLARWAEGAVFNTRAVLALTYATDTLEPPRAYVPLDVTAAALTMAAVIPFSGRLGAPDLRNRRRALRRARPRLPGDRRGVLALGAVLVLALGLVHGYFYGAQGTFFAGLCPNPVRCTGMSFVHPVLTAAVSVWPTWRIREEELAFGRGVERRRTSRPRCGGVGAHGSHRAGQYAGPTPRRPLPAPAPARAGPSSGCRSVGRGRCRRAGRRRRGRARPSSPRSDRPPRGPLRPS